MCFLVFFVFHCVHQIRWYFVFSHAMRVHHTFVRRPFLRSWSFLCNFCGLLALVVFYRIFWTSFALSIYVHRALSAELLSPSVVMDYDFLCNALFSWCAIFFWQPIFSWYFCCIFKWCGVFLWCAISLFSPSVTRQVLKTLHATTTLSRRGFGLSFF